MMPGMRYVSTRGGGKPVGFMEAVAHGLAPDGGLYVPEQLPDLTEEIASYGALSYPELAYAFLKHFATDYDAGKLKAIIERSYASFDHPEIAPVRTLEKGLHVLELFHGPTLAFKDFALQLLGNLYEAQISRTGQRINVLGATSGDTGAAAIHGLLGKEGVNIFILYPKGGVSALQERQMTCTGAANVHAIGIEGSFDDAQALVKAAFADRAFVGEVGLSAINSINLARILAQSVYYLYAWHRVPQEERGELEFIVPTGNFGNVLAGWMAQKMGLPAAGFKVATNQNDILYRLFNSGQYEIGKVLKSLAPSMDIQVASNFERFLYYSEGGDSARVCAAMEAIGQFGAYLFEGFDADTFTASRMGDSEIPEAIRRVYEQYGYVIDPHTACAFKDIDPQKTSVVLSTAHPAKFPDVLEEAIGQHPTHPSLEVLKARKPASPVLQSDTVEGVKAFIRSKGT